MLEQIALSWSGNRSSSIGTLGRFELDEKKLEAFCTHTLVSMGADTFVASTKRARGELPQKP